MIKDLNRFEVYDDQQENMLLPPDKNIADVVQLRPEASYLELSDSVISASDERILLTRRKERARRIDFLRATSYLDYKSDANIADLEEPQVDTEMASEQAWDNIASLRFSDGSSLSGNDIRFANEIGPASLRVQQEIQSIFRRIERIESRDNSALTNIDDEEYRKTLREKYEREAEEYRKFLDLTVGRILDDSFGVELTDVTLTPEVLAEIHELFVLSDEHDAIKEVELERIAKEEKRKKVLAILALLNDDDTPLPIE